MKSNIAEIFYVKKNKKLTLPLYNAPVSAGFPSPADDYIECELDLNEHLIRYPAATFFVRVSGDSLIKALIAPGDILVVDRSLEARSGDIVVAILDGEFTAKRFLKKGHRITLLPENEQYPSIEIKEHMDFLVWGVATSLVRDNLFLK